MKGDASNIVVTKQYNNSYEQIQKTKLQLQNQGSMLEILQLKIKNKCKAAITSNKHEEWEFKTSLKAFQTHVE